MSEYQVHIPLAPSAVTEAWRRYVGFAGTEVAEPLGWTSDDGSGLSVTFTAEGRDATLLSATRASSSDAVPDAVADAQPQTLAELVDGFVAYVNAAFDELDTEPGATVGDGPVGPDGTTHMPEQPQLGTDTELR